MKIGILTYHSVPNFGAQLQTLSTVCYLRNAGHEPIVLNWYPRDLDAIYCMLPQEQLRAHDEFVSKYLPVSAICRTENELLAEIKNTNIDAILLGSDALFKYIPLKNRWYIKMGKYKPRLIMVNVPSVERLLGNPFFGDFLEKLNKRIPATVYAVSAQNTQYESMNFLEKRLMKSYMKNFNMISVRDIRTQQMVESVMDITGVKIYPDPVFAFNANAKDFIPSKNDILTKFNIQQKYILFSFRTDKCSDEYIQAMAACAMENGFLPVALAMPEGVRDAGIQKVVSNPLSPMDWYALIKYSSGYIGERMHSIVVALHNAVPCFSFDEYGCNSVKRVIYPRQKPFQKETSKIYHIMHEAGMDNCWYSMNTQDELPSPENVIRKVIEFDRDKCSTFANKQHSNYVEGMSAMLKSLRR